MNIFYPPAGLSPSVSTLGQSLGALHGPEGQKVTPTRLQAAACRRQARRLTAAQGPQFLMNCFVLPMRSFTEILLSASEGPSTLEVREVRLQAP